MKNIEADLRSEALEKIESNSGMGFEPNYSADWEGPRLWKQKENGCNVSAEVWRKITMNMEDNIFWEVSTGITELLVGELESIEK